MGCPTEDHWYIPYGTPGTMGQSQSVTSHLVGCPYRSKALSFNSYEKFIKLRVRKVGVTEVIKIHLQIHFENLKNLFKNH